MAPRTIRQRVRIVTKNDLLALLNEDFARECRSIYAHAVYAERYCDSNPELAQAIGEEGRHAARTALELCQLIYDYGGTVENPGDELNFVLNADRVADPRWKEETIHRLRQRIGQLRAIGEPGYAKRLRQIITGKRERVELVSLLAR
jgi:hypothetical protein